MGREGEGGRVLRREILLVRGCLTRTEVVDNRALIQRRVDEASLQYGSCRRR